MHYQRKFCPIKNYFHLYALILGKVFLFDIALSFLGAKNFDDIILR